MLIHSSSRPARSATKAATPTPLPPVSDMFSLYRISLILVVALVLHDGVLVCWDEFETGPPFDEDEGLEECNDDNKVCEVSEAESLHDKGF